MAKKLVIPKQNTGFGYAGVFEDGTLGWSMPAHVQGKKYDKKQPHFPVYRKDLQGERLFLCKITITPLKDKKGRPITAVVKDNRKTKGA